MGWERKSSLARREGVVVTGKEAPWETSPAHQELAPEDQENQDFPDSGKQTKRRNLSVSWAQFSSATPWSQQCRCCRA